MTPVNNMGCVTKSLSGTKVLILTTIGDTSSLSHKGMGLYFSFIAIFIHFHQINLHTNRNNFCINFDKKMRQYLIRYAAINKPLKLQIFWDDHNVYIDNV